MASWEAGPYLDVSRQWEILPQRMSLESVIRQDPPQIRVVGEVDAKHVPDFAFVPVGGLEDGVDRLDRGQLVGVGLDPDPGVEAEGEQVVNELEKNGEEII